MIRKMSALVSLLIFVTACQTLGEHKRAETLESTLKRYEASVRWTSGSQLHNFLPPDETRNDPVINPDSKNIRVTHYEIVQGPSMLGEDRAVQTAVIQYVVQDIQVVRELTDQQDWHYDEEAESWYLYSPIPVFK
ncbi:MAG: asparagine synthetase [Candidatus Thiodiazotropha sp.]